MVTQKLPEKGHIEGGHWQDTGSLMGKPLRANTCRKAPIFTSKQEPDETDEDWS